MRRRTRAALGLALALGAPAWAPGGAGAQVELTGRLQQELAYRYAAAPALTKGLAFIQLEAGAPVGTAGRLTAIGRAWYDPVLDFSEPDRINPDLAPGDPVRDAFHGAELKELYLDVLTDAVDLRVGRQIVRWGLLEGTRITDRVNPLDFREFLFRDVEDRYIPLWMLRASYYPTWGQTQVLVIPDMTFHKPAPAGSEWEEFQLPPDTRKPKVSLKNTELGLLLGGRWGETAWTASYLYTWDDFPAAFRSVFGVAGALTGASFDARYERLHIFGLTASRSVGPAVLNFEGAYDHGKHLATDTGALPSGGNEIARDIAHWGAGVDANVAGVDVSVVYFQEQVIGWKPYIPVDRVERAASLLMRESYLHNRVDAQLLVLYFHAGHQYVARPRVDWRLTDRTKLSVGVDLLGGQRGSDPSDATVVRDFRFVGYLKDHDRATATVSYRF
jgi:hypothetical protein